MYRKIVESSVLCVRYEIQSFAQRKHKFKRSEIRTENGRLLSTWVHVARHLA